MTDFETLERATRLLCEACGLDLYAKHRKRVVYREQAALLWLNAKAIALRNFWLRT